MMLHCAVLVLSLVSWVVGSGGPGIAKSRQVSRKSGIKKAGQPRSHTSQLTIISTVEPIRNLTYTIRHT